MTEEQKYRNEEIKCRCIESEVPLHIIYCLIDMAEHNEYPDGTFGDIECELWSKFRKMLRKE